MTVPDPVMKLRPCGPVGCWVIDTSDAVGGGVPIVVAASDTAA